MNLLSVNNRNLTYNTNIRLNNNVTFCARRNIQNDTFEYQNTPQRTFLQGLIQGFSSIFHGSSTPEIKREDIFETEEEIQNNENSNHKSNESLDELLNDADYDRIIKKASQGKYQKEFLSFLSKENMSDKLKQELLESDLTQKEFLDGVKSLSTSTFKAALNNPEQYINYTQDSKYLMFRAKVMTNGVSYSNRYDEAKDYMVELFETNLVKLIKLLRYTDLDTINQMMDKRSTSFISTLDSLSEITPENGELLKSLISKTQEGNARQKIKLAQLVEIFQSNGFDMKILKDMADSENIDTKALNDIFKKALVEKLNLTCDIEDSSLNFNDDYIYLLFSRTPLMNNGKVTFETDDLDAVIKAAVSGTFDDFIQDTSNKYGKVNENTKIMFENAGLDYEQWLHPDFEAKKFNLNNKTMTLKLWERNPFEDLFLGNKTRCCTAITTGSNSEAMPIFLLNSAFNYVEVTDEKGEVKGMARFYVVNADNRTSVMIDSIELTDIKEMKDKDKVKVATNIFNYLSEYSTTLNGEKLPVYYIQCDSKIPVKDKVTPISFEFLGDITSETIYSNSNAGTSWSDIKKPKRLFVYDTDKFLTKN